MPTVQVAQTIIGVAVLTMCVSGTSIAQAPGADGARGEASAPHPPITRRSISVSFGLTDPWWHYRQSGPADADKAISLEFRLGERVGMQVEVGTTTWTLTGPSSRAVQNEDGSFSPEPPRSDDVTATRVTVSYVGRARPHSAVTIVWMTGGGYYHFSSDTSELRRDRPGAHAGAGIEIPVGGRFSVGGHGLRHAIFGRSLTLPRSRIAMHTVWLYSASVDLGVYF